MTAAVHQSVSFHLCCLLVGPEAEPLPWLLSRYEVCLAIVFTTRQISRLFPLTGQKIGLVDLNVPSPVSSSH